MKIFVTGSTGVIGRRVVPALAGAGHRVTAVVRSSTAWRQLQQQGATPVEVDLFDRSALRTVIAGHDAVVNLATHIPHKPASVFLPWAWRENDRIRKWASAALVDAALDAGVKRFLQESFAPVYPDRGDQWIDEETPIEPVRYNRSIADAEASARRFERGGESVVLRFGAFYGPDSIQTQYLVDSIERGWAPLPGAASAYMSSVSHDDAAAAAVAALEVPSGVYNVVDDEPLTHGDLVNSLAKLLHAAPPRLPPVAITGLFGSLGRMFARSVRISNRKLRAASAWSPRFPAARDGWPEVIAGLRTADRRTAA